MIRSENDGAFGFLSRGCPNKNKKPKIPAKFIAIQFEMTEH